MKKRTLTLFMLCIYSCLPAQVDLLDGLVAHYSFNNNFVDQSTFVNDAIAEIGTDFDEGLTGSSDQAIYFDGTGQGSYVEIPNASQLNFNTDELFTLSVWLKIPPIQNSSEGTINDIVSKWAGTSSQPYSYNLRIHNQNSTTKGVISAAVYDTNTSACNSNNNSTGVKSTTTVDDNQWHHILLTRTANGLLRLYIDCNLEDETEDLSICSLTNEENLVLGRRNTGLNFPRPFTGGMDELRIYNRELNPMEVEILCDAVNSTDQLGSNDGIQFFPNPIARGTILTVQFDDEVSEAEAIEIYTATGQYLKRFQAGTVIDLPAGVYLVGIKYQNSKQVFKKLVVTN